MKLQRPAQADLDCMSHAEKDALILKLFDVLEDLECRLKAIEEKVEKTSRNSSKPPSLDGLKEGRGGAAPTRRAQAKLGETVRLRTDNS
jgi:transposase